MTKRKVNKLALMCAASVVALTTGAAHAQQTAQNTESVTVTGSRIISDITLSPTPITAVTADQLQATTPTDIPDALNKLPDFIGGASPRSQNNGQNNNSGNTLSLRNLGAIRTLVLLDGHRVAPSNRDGTVNVDALPQMLMSRVDVVTGGASAVYGSDGVAGVVNFILDKKYDGFKYDINAGISKYGDAAEERIGLAWGTELFGGRGHYEMALRLFQQDGIQMQQRPYGYNHNTWVQAGDGSAANPFTNVPYGHLFNQGLTGTITCGTGCALNSYTFTGAGQIVPMTHGIPTGTAGLESGGDGGFQDNVATLQSRQRQGEFFNRFSYDITPDLNFYVQGSWEESADYSTWAPLVVSASSSRPNTFFTNNPYLSSDAQTRLTAAATAAGNFAKAPVPFSPNPSKGLPTVTGPAVASNTPVFTAPSYVPQIVNGQNAQSQGAIYITKGLDRNLGITTGLTGKLSSFNWEVYYSHQESRVQVFDPTNTNNARYLAAQDAVIAPTGLKVNGVDVGGTIQCWVTTQAQFASLYPGCVPINLFNPGQGISQASWNYLKNPTFWALTQQLDNIGGSISGGLGFGLPAGEITSALSAEMRWRSYDLKSNAEPTDFVNCTGLRLCTQNGGAAPSLYTQNTNAPVSVNDNVWETALEINVPLLKDFPLAEELSADIAGRYTDYSISGTAETWKIGINDRINDTVRLRGTMSYDLRAPNLNDLFAPTSVTSTGFTDLLTKAPAGGTQLVTKGNSTLTPEVAHTYTLGVVLTPDFIPGLTASLDYYVTHMTNAITNISYQSTTVQNLCISSAPTYSSPYCLLAARPVAPGGAGYNAPANFPTQIFSSPLNSANIQMEGWNLELDYNFDLADVWSAIPGSVTLRHLMTYQPVLETQNLPGTPYSWTTQPKTRMTSFLSYTVGDWGLDLQNQWLSGWKKASGLVNQNYAAPRISSYDALDVTVSRRFEMLGGDSSLYFSVQNIGNTRAPLNPTNSSNPGLFYPTNGSAGPGFSYNDMGRYFTIGLRGNL